MDGDIPHPHFSSPRCKQPKHAKLPNSANSNTLSSQQKRKKKLQDDKGRVCAVDKNDTVWAGNLRVSVVCATSNISRASSNEEIGLANPNFTNNQQRK